MKCRATVCWQLFHNSNITVACRDCPAGNQLAVLRIYCATGNWQAAEDLVASCQDPAAAFHLARLYEAQDKFADALRCYSVSKRFSHGARLAKRYAALLAAAVQVDPTADQWGQLPHQHMPGLP